MGPFIFRVEYFCISCDWRVLRPSIYNLSPEKLTPKKIKELTEKTNNHPAFTRCPDCKAEVMRNIMTIPNGWNIKRIKNRP